MGRPDKDHRDKPARVPLLGRIYNTTRLELLERRMAEKKVGCFALVSFARNLGEMDGRMMPSSDLIQKIKSWRNGGAATAARGELALVFKALRAYSKEAALNAVDKVALNVPHHGMTRIERMERMMAEKNVGCDALVSFAYARAARGEGPEPPAGLKSRIINWRRKSKYVTATRADLLVAFKNWRAYEPPVPLYVTHHDMTRLKRLERLMEKKHIGSFALVSLAYARAARGEGPEPQAGLECRMENWWREGRQHASAARHDLLVAFTTLRAVPENAPPRRGKKFGDAGGMMQSDGQTNGQLEQGL